MMGLNGISAVLATVGGIIFIVVVVGSILFGKRIAGGSEEPKPEQPDASPVGQYGSAEAPAVPGTLVLVGVFFISFILYYFVNWKYLAEIWPLR
jgi:cytochrome c oxidase subunit 1